MGVAKREVEVTSVKVKDGLYPPASLSISNEIPCGGKHSYWRECFVHPQKDFY